MPLDPIETVLALDRCWLEGRFDDADALLASDVVVVSPNGRRFKGREAVVSGYRDFVQNNQVHTFAPADHVVTEHADTAIVEYAWTMEWTGGDQTHKARAREILVLTRTDQVWRIMWRTQIPVAEI